MRSKDKENKRCSQTVAVGKSPLNRDIHVEHAHIFQSKFARVHIAVKAGIFESLIAIVKTMIEKTFSRLSKLSKIVCDLFS